MQPNSPSIPAHRRRSRSVVAALLLAAGCAGSGSSYGSSCGGAFTTVDGTGQPFAYHGDRLANVAQVRITQDGFNFLNAQHLNDLLTAFNGASSGFNIPCIAISQGLDTCSLPIGKTRVQAIVGDSDFSGACEATDATPISMTFKEVTWGFDPDNTVLRAKIIAHIKSGDLYLRTKEAHSSLCSNPKSPIQARIFIDDELPGLHRADTEIDLDLQFTTAPDGRLEINPTDASLNAILQHFDVGAIILDGNAGTHPAPPALGHYTNDGCDPETNTYPPLDGASSLRCAGLFDTLNGNCNYSDQNQGAFCQIIQQAKEYLFDYLQTTFKTQIKDLVRKQLDKVRCVRSTDSQGNAVDCDANHHCPIDDDGAPLVCDTARGVCGAAGQAAPHCEPLALAIAGQLDVGGLTDKVGFPQGTKMEIFAGLGGKTAPAAINATGLQLSAQAGTAPAGGISVCVPPVSFPPDTSAIPALDFDLAGNKPVGVGNYSVGFAIASQMLNRGFFDAYQSGMMCLSVSNKTSAFVSSGLIKTFLPSLGELTQGRDVPMAILLRPTTAPSVRIGKGTVKTLPDQTVVPDDPLITINLKQLNLEFYALIDERMVRLFTLQTDLALPLGLRTFAGNQADTLQPVLGALDTVLTNLSAKNNEMLAEDPGEVKDLIGAAVRLAGPLLAGVLKPISLPRMLGLDFQVNGLAGAVPVSSNIAVDGFHHLAIWATIAECGSGGVTCARYNTKTEARIASRIVPDDVDELRGPGKLIPSVEIEAAAHSARTGKVDFSYRVDGGFWSPWVAGPRFTVRDEIFLFQGHHSIEVTSREAGDDRTQDPEPVSLDFFVGIEPPTVSLVQLNEGSVRTRGYSVASRPEALRYSYRLEGDRAFGEQGAARDFTAEELGGRGIEVLIIDEAGRSAKAHLGMTGAEADRVLTAAAGGCATAPGAPAWSLLPLLVAGLFIAFRRRAA